MADTTVLGLTLAKVNGIYHLDVRNMRWSVRRANQQHVTGAGIKQATGFEMPSGTIDEIIPRDKRLNWRALRNFSIEVFDKETRSIVIASFTGCNWTSLDGSTDLSQANTSRSVGWNGSEVVTS